MNTHEVLVAAKAYLIEHGWKQYSLGGAGGGPACMLGACDAGSRALGVADDLGFGPPEVDDLLKAVIGIPVVEFNDATGRTFIEVIDAFDRAILATAPEAPVESLAAPVAA